MSEKANNFLIPVSIIVAGCIIGGAVLFNGQILKQPSTVSQSGEAGSEVAGTAETSNEEENVTISFDNLDRLDGNVLSSGVNNFDKIDAKICTNDSGLPLVYYFGSSSCPHCTWEHPRITGTMDYFSDYVDFKDWMDVQSEEAMSVFQEYSEYNGGGAIPFIVFGCQYTRLGSGERLGTDAEVAVLAAVTCKLTNGEPREVCDPLRDLTSEL